MSTHDETDKNSKHLLKFGVTVTICSLLDRKMLCINEISGILDHTEACESIVEMAHAPHIGLHPEIRAYALTLIELQVPITQLQQQCREFAKDDSVMPLVTSITDLYLTITKPRLSIVHSLLDSVYHNVLWQKKISINGFA